MSADDPKQTLAITEATNVMDPKSESQIVVTDTSDFYARLIAPGAMFLVILAIWTLVRMIWKDVDDRRILLLTGSIVSLVFLLTVPAAIRRETIHSAVKAVVMLLMLLPFAFGCYLVAYEGLWRLRFLDSGFSFGLIFATIVYAVGGFGVVKATFNISEFGRSLNAGRIRFERLLLAELRRSPLAGRIVSW